MEGHFVVRKWILSCSAVCLASSIALLLASCGKARDTKQQPVATDEGKRSSAMTLDKQIGNILRDLVIREKKSIQADAPFVYESDVFAGGITHTDPNRMVIGKWVVEFADNTATATVKKRYSDGVVIDIDIVEVTFDIHGDEAKMKIWRAYQQHGRVQK
jgi:hypothetical protein